MVLGSVEQLVDEAAARQAISPLLPELNRGGAGLKTRSMTISDLVSHYRERELDPDTVWKTHSPKVTYEGYLNKWILPRWGNYPLMRVNAGKVELWLRSLTLARASCAKIRNLMSVLFNHGIRHEICDRNPIRRWPKGRLGQSWLSKDSAGGAEPVCQTPSAPSPFVDGLCKRLKI